MTREEMLNGLAALLTNSSNEVAEKPSFKNVSLKDFAAGKAVSLHKDDPRTTSEGKEFTSYGLKIGDTICQFSSQINHEDQSQRLDMFKNKTPQECYTILKQNADQFDVIQKYDKTSKCFVMRSSGEPVLTIVQHNSFGEDSMTETW